MLVTTEGQPGPATFIGFGTSETQANPLVNPIDLTGVFSSYAFQMPRNGVLRRLTVTYTTVGENVIPTGSVNIYAQLYVANQNSNLYYPINQSLIQLTPSLTGVVADGTILTGTANINVNVSENQKLLLVIYAIPTGTGGGEITVTGVVNAGLTIN